MSNVEPMKEQLNELWNEEAKAIIEARDERRREADDLRRAYRTLLEAVEDSDRIRAEIEPLAEAHSRALLEDDADEAGRIKARAAELEDRAQESEQRAVEAFSRLKTAGVEAQGRDDLERALAAKIALLEGQSREEIEILEKVGREAEALLSALRDQAKPFISNLPDATILRQSGAFEITRV